MKNNYYYLINTFTVLIGHNQKTSIFYFAVRIFMYNTYNLLLLLVFKNGKTKN